jgi:tetratricopeptide (TPR) repeat protein
MNKANPVQQELEKLDEQWEDFISSQLPVFHWYFSPDDIQLGLTFIKAKEQLDEKNPELFIHLHSEFLASDAFGRALAEEMNHMIEDGIADAGLAEAHENALPSTTHQWSKPELNDCTTGFNCIFRSCTQALASFGDYVHNIVLVITPSRIKNPTQYTQWWAECCNIHSRYDWPKSLKLVVFDTDRNSALSTLAHEQPTHIHSVEAPVDMAAAIQAILREVDDGSPNAKFRQHTVDLQKAVGKRDKSAIDSLSAAAIALAEQHHWLDMWVVTLLTRAAGYLSLKTYDVALKDYRNAQVIAAQGEQENVPGCDKLQLQAMVCEGTCLFSAERFDEAAIAYAKGAQLAEQQQDLMLTLEGWRMASFSMERMKDKNQAWDYAIKAVEAGRKMNEEQRPQSTLPFLGQALLRLSPNSDVDKQIKLSFTELLGEGWLENIEAMTC